MLTCTDTNRLDAIATTTSVLAMLSDLLANRRPGADMALSDTGASGLFHIMELVTETLEDAAIGLQCAQEEAKRNAAATAQAQDAADAFQSGYAEGVNASVGLREHNTAFFLGLRVGTQATAEAYANGVHFTPTQDAQGRDLRHMVMDTLSGGIEELRAQMAQTEGETPMPILTEPVPANAQAVHMDTEERQIA